ncbi:C5a anaphylatoxin chemotactic receptor 1-like [Narcine bancroftii]|uniref:C5a anaphylatoxin chemotactic receptor 1-like n=1 Tax=Narcine bancroftii TaxID=1343680 RepID=UPI0038315C9B
MAVADLIFLTFGTIHYHVKELYFPYSFLNYTPVCRLHRALMYTSFDCSVWLTVLFTFDRFVAICLQKLRVKYYTELIASRIIIITCIFCVLENIPVYFVYEPLEIMDSVQWYCIVSSSFYTSPFWFAYFWSDTICTPFVPFLLVLLLNTLTIRNIVWTNIVRAKLRRPNIEKNQTDQEIEKRRKSIILLMAISGNFVLLWMVTFVCFICVNFTDNKLTGTNVNDSFTIAERVGYILRFMSTCTNTFIYVVAQRYFREEFKKIITRMFVLINPKQ